MTLNFGLRLFAQNAEQQEISTAMPNARRAFRANMVKVLLMLNALLEVIQVAATAMPSMPANIETVSGKRVLGNTRIVSGLPSLRVLACQSIPSWTKS
jgi:hypothetical protein